MVDVEITQDGGYAIGNRNSSQGLSATHPSSSTAYSACGNSFKTLNDGNQYKIKSVTFTLRKVGSPTGTAYCVLYAHSGVFGTSSVPTGGALATSDGFDVSTLTTTYTDTNITFSGAQQITLTANTTYCIDFENPSSGTIDGTNFVAVGTDTTSPTHEGNFFRYNNGGWAATSGTDCAGFYVYGELVAGGGMTVPVAFHHLKSMNNAHVTD